MHRHGRAVQVNPTKPKFKLPGTKRLKLKCDILLSTSAFKFNLRRYDMPVIALTASIAKDELQGCLDAGFTDVTTKPLQRDLCRKILAQHGHSLPPEELRRSHSLPPEQLPSAMSLSKSKPRRGFAVESWSE